MPGYFFRSSAAADKTLTDKWIHLDIKKLTINRKCLLKILGIGLPAGIQSAVFNLANVVIQSAINSLGTVVIAASSAAFNIEILVYYVFNSFSQACTTFVGQNYGAGQIKRCKRTLLLCLIEDSIASAAAIILILCGSKFLLSLFNRNTQVIAIGYERLIIIFIAYCFSMLYEVMSGYLRGFGISLVPAILTTIGVCGTRHLKYFILYAMPYLFSYLIVKINLKYQIYYSFGINACQLFPLYPPTPKQILTLAPLVFVEFASNISPPCLLAIVSAENKPIP